DDVNIDTTISTRRLPRPSAATGHVLNRIVSPPDGREKRFEQGYLGALDQSIRSRPEGAELTRMQARPHARLLLRSQRDQAVYNSARISPSSGKSGRTSFSLRYAAPADPPVPRLVPIVR